MLLLPSITLNTHVNTKPILVHYLEESAFFSPYMTLQAPKVKDSATVLDS